MALSNEEVAVHYFRFLNMEIPVEDFEQWIYATPELADYLGETIYFELASFNFRQPAAKHEFFKLIETYPVPPAFYGWRLKCLLQNLLDESMDPAVVFEILSELLFYVDEYSFLSDLGIQHIWVGDIPKSTERHLWDEKEYQRLREPLNKDFPRVRQEMEVLVKALESGDLKFINETEYQLEPGLAQKIENYNQACQLEREQELRQYKSKHQKKWWQFWK